MRSVIRASLNKDNPFAYVKIPGYDLSQNWQRKKWFKWVKQVEILPKCINKCLRVSKIASSKKIRLLLYSTVVFWQSTLTSW